MKTIFIKQNSNRLPQYQTMTTIVEDDSGRRYAIKEPLHEDAKKHIDNIFFNYKLLKNQFNINLVKPTKKSNQIQFEMAQGQLMEKLMSMALEERNPTLFESYIQKFVSYVDQFVTKRNVEFQPCNQFKTVFGEWTISEPQDLLECANIDMIFGNLFIFDNKFTLIDYEWVFEFSIPKSFIIWRAIFVFSIYHNIESFINNLKPFFKHHEDFLKLDHSFNAYVYGKKKKYLLSDSVKKATILLPFNKDSVNFSSLFIQLFFQMNEDATFNEKNSIRLPISKDNEFQEFVFELSDIQGKFQSLRLDPLNESCVIEIKNLYLETTQCKIDLESFIYSNSIVSYGGKYFFYTDDAQILFHDLDISKVPNVQKLIINIRYVQIEKEVLFTSFKNFFLEKEVELQSLSTSNTNLSEEIIGLNNKVTELEQDRSNLSMEIEILSTSNTNLSEEIIGLNNKVTELEQDRSNLSMEIEILSTSNTNLSEEIIGLNNKVAELENIIWHYCNSFSWNITKPIRLVGNIIEQFNRGDYMQYKKDMKIIFQSGLFDEKYYVNTYNDVKESGINPLKHFCKYGWKEERNPSSTFKISSYPDVLNAGINPLVHFIISNGYTNPLSLKNMIKFYRNYSKKYPGTIAFKRVFTQCLRTIRESGIRGLYNKVISYLRDNSSSPFSNTEYTLIHDFLDNNIGLPQDIAVHAHIFYSDLGYEIRNYLTNIPVKFFLYITTDTKEKAQLLEKIFFDMKNILGLDIQITENIGRDLAPMIIALGSKLSKHDIVLHIHSKRSPHNMALRGWRRYLMESLLGNSQRVSNILQQFVKYPSLGILFPLIYNPIRPCMNIGDNYNNMLKLAMKHGKDYKVIENLKKDYFPAGSMFWFRGKAIWPFVQMQLKWQDFEQENGQSDGTLAHAIERMFIYFAEDAGFQTQMYSTYQFDPDSSVSGIDWFRMYIAKGLIQADTIIFDHNFGGGTNVYSNVLIKSNLLNDKDAVLRCTYKDNFWFIEWIKIDDSILFATADINILFEVLKEVGSKHIIVNSFYGYSNIAQVVNKIIDLTQFCKTSLVYKVHDFHALCPSPHLLNFENIYCAIPQSHIICTDCLKKNSAWYIKNSWSNDIDEWRLPFHQLLKASTNIDFFDSSAVDIYRKVFHLEDFKIRIVPHQINYFNCSQKIDLSGMLHIGILGTLTMVKGGAVVNALYDYINKQKMQIPITVVGSSMLPLSPQIKIIGSYKIDELPEIICANGINVIFISSIVPETFSYTVSEAIEMGLPIVAFDIGAQGNRVKQYKLGKVIPLDSSPSVIMSAIQDVYKINKESKI
ncbi:rhamnan synthesis F family protein [Sulfurospirillum cavolei]|uniref:rhamnan synthesis F family protein n=1 Tax=Sulfurospirillum cavolei TaxID=366522 RepID=UPI000764A931|nr:rhamnan synthesis F family protein [Sulfurospirillum cavolei]